MIFTPDGTKYQADNFQSPLNMEHDTGDTEGSHNKEKKEKETDQEEGGGQASLFLPLSRRYHLLRNSPFSVNL